MKIRAEVTCPFCGIAIGTKRTMSDKAIRDMARPVAFCESEIEEVVSQVTGDAFDHIARCQERPR
jgi:hypothetical protein